MVHYSTQGTLMRHTTSGKTDNPTVTKGRDTLQVMRGTLPPELLTELACRIEAGGGRCVVFDNFEGVRAALDNPRSKMLFLEVGGDMAGGLAEIIGPGGRGNVHDIPVLVYMRELLSSGDQEKLVCEIDDFILAPLNLDDLYLRIRRLLRRSSERRLELEHTTQQLVMHLGMQQFIGGAPAFVAATQQIPRVAAYDVAVLLTGDTGTGKEMCARAIHYLSPRAHKPFIPVNCGSIPPDLFENEMFGHEPGAFTDARHSRRGLIAEAEGGTLFLDEVDSLPPMAQVKLLRFLQDRQYRPLGASHYRKADTRLLAASNQRLQDRGRDGSFREDLYHRPKGVSLRLPALRDRREDIGPLAVHFSKISADEYRLPVPKLSHNAFQNLNSYLYPGNVREWENVIRQAVILAEGPVLRAHHIQLSSEPQGAAS